MSQVTSDADAVSVPVAGSDPSPRSAALRFGLGSLNPGSKAGRAPPVASAGEPSPLRCPREGRCGAEAPVAHASSQVLGSRRRGFPRVAVSRLAPLRCARSTRPPLGPLGDPGPRRRSAPRRLAEHPSSNPRAPSCRGTGRKHPSEAARAILADFHPAPALPEGSGPERRSERLTRPQGDPAAGASGMPRTFVPGGGRVARLANVTTLTTRNAPLDLHPSPGWGLINPSPPRERNSTDRPPQSSGGPPARPEELTRGVEIPGKPGGSAST